MQLVKLLCIFLFFYSWFKTCTCILKTGLVFITKPFSSVHFALGSFRGFWVSWEEEVSLLPHKKLKALKYLQIAHLNVLSHSKYCLCQF